jgi:uncharacterized membrane protein
MKKKEHSKTLIQLIKFFSPIIIGLIVVYLVGLSLGSHLQIRFYPLITGYFFPPLGKETIIPAGIALGIHKLIMGLAIAFVDIIVALFLVWNYDLAKKIPFIGKFMIKVEDIGKSSSEKYGWVKPLRFIGIILFVMVPFQGSGGLVGSILGRLIGMKPWNTFIAISIGAIVGCLSIAYFSEAIILVFINNVLLGLLVIIILPVIIFMIFIWRKNKKNRLKTN